MTVLEQEHISVIYSKECSKMKNLNEENIINAIKNNWSVASVLREMGLNSRSGTNYKWINDIIKKYNLDISHFCQIPYNRGKKAGYKYDIKEYLENQRYITSNALKIRLFKEGIKQQKCEKCNLTEWIGTAIPLELHHVDGNHANNNLSNLQILCPNCHALTPNFCSKNRKSQYKAPKKITEEEIVNVIKKCYNIHQVLLSLNIPNAKENYNKINNIKNKYSVDFLEKKTHNEIEVNPNWRKEPKFKARKVIRPTKEILEKEILTESFSALGRKYGVSDNAVRKWCRYYQIII